MNKLDIGNLLNAMDNDNNSSIMKYTSLIYPNQLMLFVLFELFLFLLPVLPSDLNVRLGIAWIYFVGHVLGVQRMYLKFKKNAL